MKILFVIPSNINSASGRYINVLAKSINDQGGQVGILCTDGSIGNSKGIDYMRFEPTYKALNKELKAKLFNYYPNIVILVGCRSFSTQVGKFCVENMDSNLFIQHEDPDSPVLYNRLINFDVPLFEKWFTSLADPCQPALLPDEYTKYSISSYSNKSLNPWFEPISYGFCIENAVGHLSISRSMQSYMADKYNIPSIVIPPVVDLKNYQSLSLFTERLNFDKSILNFGIGGGIYDYDNSFATLIRAFSLLSNELKNKISISIFGRWWRNVESILNTNDLKSLNINFYKKPDNQLYKLLIADSDIFVIPSAEGPFSRLRFPSRIAIPMLMNKNVLVHETMASAPLVDGSNVHTYGGSCANEVKKSLENVIANYFDKKLLDISEESRLFALHYFDPVNYAYKLLNYFSECDVSLDEENILPVAIDPYSKWLDKWVFQNIKFDFNSLNLNFYSQDFGKDSKKDLDKINYSTNFPIKKLDLISEKKINSSDLNILIHNSRIDRIIIEKILKYSFNGIISIRKDLLDDFDIKYSQLVIDDSFDDMNILYYYSF